MPKPKLGREILVLAEADVQRTLTIAEAVELARAGLEADAAGEVMGDKYYMDLRPGHFLKPFSGYKTGEELFFVKTFNFFADNVDRGLPVTSSQVLLYDAESFYFTRTLFLQAGVIIPLVFKFAVAVIIAEAGILCDTKQASKAGKII